MVTDMFQKVIYPLTLFAALTPRDGPERLHLPTVSPI